MSKKRVNSFYPIKQATEEALKQAGESSIGEPVWDHLTEKNKQIGTVVDAKPAIGIDGITTGLEITIELFDKQTIDKLNTSTMKGLSIGGVVKKLPHYQKNLELFYNTAVSATSALENLVDMLKDPEPHLIDFDKIEIDINHVRKCVGWMKGHKQQMRKTIQVTFAGDGTEEEREKYLNEQFKNLNPVIIREHGVMSVTSPKPLEFIVIVEIDKFE